MSSPCSMSLSQTLPQARPSPECRTEEELKLGRKNNKQCSRFAPGPSRERAKTQRGLGWSDQVIGEHPVEHGMSF